MTFALGVRGARRSDAAIKAAMTKHTVVKKPKTFWARTMVVCIFAAVLKLLKVCRTSDAMTKDRIAFEMVVTVVALGRWIDDIAEG